MAVVGKHPPLCLCNSRFYKRWFAIPNCKQDSLGFPTTSCLFLLLGDKFRETYIAEIQYVFLAIKRCFYGFANRDSDTTRSIAQALGDLVNPGFSFHVETSTMGHGLSVIRKFTTILTSSTFFSPEKLCCSFSRLIEYRGNQTSMQTLKIRRKL